MPVCDPAGSGHAESIATDFVLKTLKKRLFSSPAAFLTTLNKHEASLRHAVKKTAGTKPTFGTLKRDIDRIDEDYANDEEYDEATGDAVETASRLFSELSDQELDAHQEDEGLGRNGRALRTTRKPAS